MTLDEAYAAARTAVRFTRITEASIRSIFDAGVAAERERCARACEKANVTYGDYFSGIIRNGGEK